jgi:hypothetical protein
MYEWKEENKNMKRKITGIGIMMLFIATAVLPAVGTINEHREMTPTNYNQPTVEWTKTFDRGEFDHFHSARQTSDGGYIACGLTEESHVFFPWLVKLYANGTEQWRKVNYDLNGTYVTGTGQDVFATDVIETSDNGFLIVGYSTIPFEHKGQTYWMAAGYFWKTDNAGNTQWVRHYYDVNVNDLTDVLFCSYNVIEVKDGFVAGGFTDYYTIDGVENTTGAIMKTDLSGNLLWENEFNKTYLDYLSSVYQTSDGGYLLGGYVEGTAYQGGDALRMVKTDKDGKLQWEQIFDSPAFEYTFGKGFYQTSDGGYVMNGVTQSYSHGGTDVWLIKTDSNGNMVWNKTFGGIRNDYSWGMCPADNNGFALGICTNYGLSSGTKDDILIVETDKDGNAEWQFQIKADGIQITRSINPTKDGGYIVSGMTGAFGYTRTDAVIVKIASFDNQQPSKPTITGPSKGKVDKNSTFTASSTDPDGGAVSYRWDWGDGNYSEWLSTAQTTYAWSYKANFEVRVMAQDENGGESVWSDPLPITIPCLYNGPSMQFWMKLFERFPNAFPLLRQLMGY